MTSALQVDLLLPVVGNLATIVTIISFFSGLETCQKIWRKGSSSELSSMPFFMGALSTFLWLRYAIQIWDKFQLFVNCIGFSCFLFYVAFFYHFSTKKQNLGNRIILFAFVSIVLYIASKIVPNQRLFTGICASTTSVLFSCSPLTVVIDVVRTKNTFRLPFYLILSSFVMSLLWFIYAVLIDDFFVKVPNGLNSIITGAELLLFVWYPSKSVSD